MNNSNDALQKVKHSCKVSASILNILKIFCGIFSVGFLLIAGGCLVLRDQLVEFISSAPEFSTNITANIRVAGLEFMYQADEHAPYVIAAALFVMALSLMFLTVGLHYLQKMFVLINTGDSPFSQEVITTMLTAFVLVTVFITASIGLLHGAFMALFLWCIYNVFKYGRVLQIESDETL